MRKVHDRVLRKDDHRTFSLCRKLADMLCRPLRIHRVDGMACGSNATRTSTSSRIPRHSGRPEASIAGSSRSSYRTYKPLRSRKDISDKMFRLHDSYGGSVDDGSS